MKSRLSRLAPVVTSMLLGLSMQALGQPGAADSNEDLRAQLNALRLRLAELEAKQNESWLSERRAEEVRALVGEVLADADTRASLLAGGSVAGHDGKQFFLASEDGAFVLNVAGQFQLRYIYNSRESNALSVAGFDEQEFGFQLRRVKLKFSGHLGSPRFTYSIGLQTDRDNETVELDHAYVGYRVADNVVLFGGESKAPFLREELVSSSRQLTIERSIANEVFTMGRIQGIWAVVEPNDATRLTVALGDGQNSGEAGGTKDFHNDATDLAFSVRADLRLAGEWGQMKDFTAWSGQQQALFIGVAVHHEVTETGGIASQPSLPASSRFNPGGAAVGIDDFFSWTIDGLIESNGMSLFASLTGLHMNTVNAASGNIDALALVVQGGYMVIADRLEPFVRWEWIDPDVRHAVNLITVGANYYLNKHEAKFTADLVWALNSLDAINGSGLGLLPDTAGETDQVAVRAQFQLLY